MSKFFVFIRKISHKILVWLVYDIIENCLNINLQMTPTSLLGHFHIQTPKSEFLGNSKAWLHKMQVSINWFIRLEWNIEKLSANTILFWAFGSASFLLQSLNKIHLMGGPFIHFTYLNENFCWGMMNSWSYLILGSKHIQWPVVWSVCQILPPSRNEKTSWEAFEWNWKVIVQSVQSSQFQNAIPWIFSCKVSSQTMKEI